MAIVLNWMPHVDRLVHPLSAVPAAVFLFLMLERLPHWWFRILQKVFFQVFFCWRCVAASRGKGLLGCSPFFWTKTKLTTLVPRISHFFCRNLCWIFFVSLSSKLNTSIGNILKLLTFDSLLTTENVFSFSNDEFNDLFPKVNSQFHGSLDCSD